MELTPATAESYLRLAFTGMLEVADRLGEPLINQRPHGPQSNAVAALVIHCGGVAEYWLGHVALGVPSDRDRESEFSRTATVAELHGLVADTLQRVRCHLNRIEAGEGIDHPDRHKLLDVSDASVVIHVLEEAYQHLGHIELTADALLA